MNKELCKSQGNKTQGAPAPRYFAFISYARVNLGAAAFIQSELEHFRYPKDAIKPDRRPDDPVFVRDVFLDRTALSGRGDDFEKILENTLAASRYLIVLCSPDAARAKADPKAKQYVEWEINTFLRHHGPGAEKHVIPIVLNGEPNAGDDSCLPRPLRTEEYLRRNLPDMRPPKGQPAGFFGRKRNWHTAIVTLLTYIFDVERTIIFDRFAAERARTRLKIGVAASVAFVICALAAGWGLLEQSRQRDEVALRRLVEATHEFTAPAEGDAFRATDLALSALSCAGRLSAAREYLYGQLLQHSWIVPLSVDTNIAKYAASFQGAARAQMPFIATPEGFPFAFVEEKEQANADPALEKLFSEASLAPMPPSIKVVQSATGKVRWTMPTSGCLGGDVDPTGLTLVLRQHRPELALRAVDPATGRELWRRRTGDLIRRVSFSPDGRRLALLATDGRLTILNARDGSAPFETYCAGPDAFDVAFSRDCARIFINKLKCVLVCGLLQFAPELPVKPLGSPLLAVGASPDGTLLAMLSSVQGDKLSLELRRARTLEVLARTELTESVPAFAAFADDGRWIAVGGGGAKNFSVFEIGETNALRRAFTTPTPSRLARLTSAPGGFVVCEDSDWISTPKPNPRLLRWCAQRPDMLQDITPAGTAPLSVARQGDLLRILSTNAVVTLEATTQREVGRIPTPTHVHCASIACGPDGTTLLATRLTRQAFVLDRKGHLLFKTAPYPESGVLPTAISADGAYCALAVSAKGVQVFETRTGVPVSRILAMPEKIFNLKFAGPPQDLRLIACGGPSNCLEKHGAYYAIIDPAQGRLVRLRAGLSSRLSDFHAIDADTLLLSGINCSCAYLLPLGRQTLALPQDGFAETCRCLAGRTVLANGVSVPQTTPIGEIRTQGAWRAFAQEAARPHDERHISFTSDIPLSISIRTLESGYIDSYERGLDLDPAHEPFLAGYWFGFARRILKERHAYKHPEISAFDRDMHFAKFTSERWVRSIFRDAQASFFCDAWTKHLLALYPNSKTAQRERDTCLRLAQFAKTQP